METTSLATRTALGVRRDLQTTQVQRHCTEATTPETCPQAPDRNPLTQTRDPAAARRLLIP